MVIAFALANSNVHRAFADRANLVNVMFKNVFEALRLPVSSLTSCALPIYDIGV